MPEPTVDTEAGVAYAVGQWVGIIYCAALEGLKTVTGNDPIPYAELAMLVASSAVDGIDWKEQAQEMQYESDMAGNAKLDVLYQRDN